MLAALRRSAEDGEDRSGADDRGGCDRPSFDQDGTRAPGNAERVEDLARLVEHNRRPQSDPPVHLGAAPRDEDERWRVWWLFTFP